MKSGLEDRNNEDPGGVGLDGSGQVSMKSGLEDRNNVIKFKNFTGEARQVSMKSGLEDRNNVTSSLSCGTNRIPCLNEVRPGRPEQSLLYSASHGTLQMSQ